MMSGIVLATLLAFAPGQAEKPPGTEEPPKLPPASAVALPPVTSGCTSCGQTPGCGGGACYGSVCDKPDLAGPPNKGWLDTSYLYYWYKPSPLPTLVTSLNGTVRTRLNGGDADFGQAAGARISGGLWVNDAHTLGYGWSGFLTEQRASFENFSSSGSPTLTRPFTDAVTNQITDFFVSDANRLSGTVRVESGARLAGGELYGLKSVRYCKTSNFSLLAGFRYMDLDEYLVIFQQTSSTNGAADPFTLGNRPNAGPINIVDRFRTRNQFWGMEFGGRGEITHKCFSFAMTAKVGLGNIHQTLDVAGQTTSPAISGGLLALSSNIGRSNPNRFGALADCSAEFGVQLTENAKIFVAYDFLYLNDVIRPGTQVDTVISQRFLPTSPLYGIQSGPTAPVKTQNHDDFFAYGLRFGYQLKY